MKIDIGYSSDDKRVRQKKFTKKFKGVKADIFYPCSYVDPVFIVASSKVESNTNYIHCDDFNRYYFVNDIVQEGDIAKIYCHVDVLMSYAVGVGSLQANVIRQEKQFSGSEWYIDDKILATVKRRVHFYDCGTTPFATSGTGQPVVLTVSGGAS